MITDLSRLLHQETDRLPVRSRAAAEVRVRAERSRRVRRAGVAALTCAAAVVVLVVSTQLVIPQAAPVVPAELPVVSTPPPAVPSTPDASVGQSTGQEFDPRHYQLAVARKGDVVVVYESTGWADRPHRTLAIAMEAAIPGQRGDCDQAEFTCRPPESSTAERPLELAPDPVLTDAAWVKVAAGESLVRAGSDPAPLVPCSADPAASHPDSMAAASYAEMPTSETPRANEFVLRFTDPAAATGALAELRERFVTCFAGTDWQPEALDNVDENGVAVITADVAAMWGYDEAFYADRHLPE